MRLSRNEPSGLRRELLLVVQGLALGWIITYAAISAPGQVLHPAFAALAGPLMVIVMLTSKPPRTDGGLIRSSLRPETQFMLLCLTWAIAIVTWIFADLGQPSGLLHWGYTVGFTVVFREGVRWLMNVLLPAGGT